MSFHSKEQVTPKGGRAILVLNCLFTTWNAATNERKGLYGN